MEEFPDDLFYDDQINKWSLLQLERMRLYYEIKYSLLRGDYSLSYRDRLYNPEKLLILLKELNERYPKRITLIFKRKNIEYKVTYDEFIEKYSNINTFVTINISLKNYTTKDSICEYHDNKIHTEDELKENHKACISHGHCLYPICCPLNCDINKKYKENTGESIMEKIFL